MHLAGTRRPVSRAHNTVQESHEVKSIQRNEPDPSNPPTATTDDLRATHHKENKQFTVTRRSCSLLSTQACAVATTTTATKRALAHAYYISAAKFLTARGPHGSGPHSMVSTRTRHQGALPHGAQAGRGAAGTSRAHRHQRRRMTSAGVVFGVWRSRMHGTAQHNMQCTNDQQPQLRK